MAQETRSATPKLRHRPCTKETAQLHDDVWINSYGSTTTAINTASSHRQKTKPQERSTTGNGLPQDADHEQGCFSVAGGGWRWQ